MATDEEKREHGLRLKAAMGAKRIDRSTVADAAGVKPRTVTNWTSGTTMPSESEKVALRALFGSYDDLGDAVEVALNRSPLIDWRREAVRSEYKRHLYEQRREESS